jgi:serine/threonine protein kinase
MHYDLIGTGNYSVVVKPSVKNVQNNEELSKYDVYKDTVGKIFDSKNKDDFHKELIILRKLVLIENYTDFTVPVISASVISRREFTYEPTIIKALLNFKTSGDNDNDTLYQIVFRNGGVSVGNSSNILNICFSDFIQIVYSFYDGIKRLQEANIVHRDIKPVNILYDADNKKLNIIDFGLACEPNMVYSFDKDHTYILSYMYMFNPPEFYIAYLIIDHMKNGNTLRKSIKMAFDTMTNYTSELQVYYFEHYYRYNRNEPYNIFSYQQAFAKFYETIQSLDDENKCNDFEKIFNEEMVFKSDIYSSSFVLKSLKKYIIFENCQQREFFTGLFNMTSALNPYNRSNVNQILEYIDDIRREMA